MRFDLGFDEVHVRYQLTDRISEEAHLRALHALPPDERQRAARFVFPKDRIGFVAAHSLLRHTLSDYEDVPAAAWAFTTNRYGKPAPADQQVATNLRFNLAHTQGLVACAVCRGVDVGIDVESLEPRFDPLDLARQYFSQSEVASLHACPEEDRHTRFIEHWTLKEAYVKAIGVGLSHPLGAFGFVLEGATTLRFEPPTSDDGSGWHFALLAPSPRHRMAVAVGGAAHGTLKITAWAEGFPNTVPPVLRVSGPAP
jgi:4'-phosphopantetheinyl transferase